MALQIFGQQRRRRRRRLSWSSSQIVNNINNNNNNNRNNYNKNTFHLFTTTKISPSLTTNKLFGLISILILIILQNVTFTSFGSVLATSMNDNSNVIRLIEQPPITALISKLNPIYLQCTVQPPFYYATTTNDEKDEEKNNDDHHRYLNFRHELVNNITNNNNENDDDDSIDHDEFESRVKRQIDKERQVTNKWFRNGRLISKTRSNDLFIFSNGTLRISYSKFAAGIYHCLVNGQKFDHGILRSQSCNVQQAVFTRIQTFTNSFTVNKGNSIMLNCPYYSVPKANITWQFANRTHVNFYQSNRYFQLINGSLLIINAHDMDNQKFKCSAENVFSVNKTLRTYQPLLHVNIPDTTIALKNTIASAKMENFKLLPKLQNEILKIMMGEKFELICATENSINSITWTFKSSEFQNSLPTVISSTIQSVNKIVFTNVTQEKHGGIYNCSTKTDYQLFTVIILEPPKLLQNFSTMETKLADFVKLNCSVTGNPKPEITWYRNGEKLEFNDFIITWESPQLIINTFDLAQSGYYQCIAKNEAGQIETNGLITLKSDSYLSAPEITNCLPLNETTLLIHYKKPHSKIDGIIYYIGSNHSTTKKRWRSFPLIAPVAAYDDYYFLSNVPYNKFELFSLYIRIIENQGTFNHASVYISSHLSLPVQCALQGLPLSSVSDSGGIIIWWPSVNHLNVKYLSIQIKQNPLKRILPMGEMVGTTRIIGNLSSYPEIFPHLFKINVTINEYNMTGNDEDSNFIVGSDNNNNVDDVNDDDIINNDESDYYREKRSRHHRYRRSSFQPSSSENGVGGSGDIISPSSAKPKKNNINSIGNGHKMVMNNFEMVEIRVPGNLTGILIPNTEKMVVRVIVPIFNDDNVELEQDTRFVEWKTISNFVTFNAFARLVAFNVTDKTVRCIHVCFGDGQPNCYKIISNSSEFTMSPLTPNTDYIFSISKCGDTDKEITKINVHTRPDVVGPVNITKIIRDKHLILEWNPPDNISDNSISHYYSIEWTVRNETNIVNVSVDTKRYEFHNIDGKEKCKIKITAVGNYGLGLPQYLNLNNDRGGGGGGNGGGENNNNNDDDDDDNNDDNDENDDGLNLPNPYESDTHKNDPYLGIIIGVMLSILLLLICMWIIIRHRQLIKHRSGGTMFSRGRGNGVGSGGVGGGGGGGGGGVTGDSFSRLNSTTCGQQLLSNSSSPPSLSAVGTTGLAGSSTGILTTSSTLTHRSHLSPTVIGGFNLDLHEMQTLIANHKYKPTITATATATMTPLPSSNGNLAKMLPGDCSSNNDGGSVSQLTFIGCNGGSIKKAKHFEIVDEQNENDNGIDNDKLNNVDGNCSINNKIIHANIFSSTPKKMDSNIKIESVFPAYGILHKSTKNEIQLPPPPPSPPLMAKLTTVAVAAAAAQTPATQPIGIGNMKIKKNGLLPHQKQQHSTTKDDVMISGDNDFVNITIPLCNGDGLNVNELPSPPPSPIQQKEQQEKEQQQKEQQQVPNINSSIRNITNTTIPIPVNNLHKQPQYLNNSSNSLTYNNNNNDDHENDDGDDDCSQQPLLFNSTIDSSKLDTTTTTILNDDGDDDDDDGNNDRVDNKNDNKQIIIQNGKHNDYDDHDEGGDGDDYDDIIETNNGDISRLVAPPSILSSSSFIAPPTSASNRNNYNSSNIQKVAQKPPSSTSSTSTNQSSLTGWNFRRPIIGPNG